jgi:hypothetical protein
MPPPRWTGIRRHALLARQKWEGIMPKWLLGLVLTMATMAAAKAEQGALPYPDIADTSHATPAAAKIFRDFFTAKSLHKPDALMTYFAKENVLYIDASSGGIWPSWDALNTIFTTYMPKWPASGLSYPTRIYGDEHSALVAFTDTPELFGKELRILGAVSFDDQGKIVRWMDYWDGRSSQRVTAPLKPTYPTEFHDDVGNAGGKIRDIATALETAFAAGDAKAAAAMFAYDAVYEDMALHAQILGRLAIERYLTRALASVPYGKGAALAHVVGNDLGGGYEWRPAASFPMRRGNIALELDKGGAITRFTVVYDSGLLPDDQYRALVALAAEN